MKQPNIALRHLLMNKGKGDFIFYATCLIWLAGFSLTGCSALTPLTTQRPPSLNVPKVQPLPITAQFQVEQAVIELEVAATPEAQQQGLMYRTELAPNRGMLFSFSPPKVARFWMKNTLISLDMIFLKDGEIKAIFPHVPPCKVDPCPVYGPSTDVDQVIELAAGRAQSLGLQVGDHLEIIPLKTIQ